MKGDGYIIEKDHLENKVVGIASADYPVEFKLYDDDGELYFSGKMKQELYESPKIFNPLDDTMDSHGCTFLEVKNPKTGKWKII